MKIKADTLNCFITFDEKMIDSKETRVALDDNILVKNELSTAGSKFLHNFKPPFGATVVDKIKDSGMIIVGKTNVGEFGIGDSTDNSFKGAAKNPLNTDFTAGGAAAAVSAGFADVALGSDSNGTARKFAAQAGVCYIKPTYGTVSRFGLVANVSSMEQIGVYSNSFDEGFEALSVISGYDKNDGTSYPKQEYVYATAGEDINGIKIGIPADFLNDVDSEILTSTEEFCKKIENSGAVLERFEFPLAKFAASAQLAISSAEASNNISRFDGVKYGYRTENYKNINDLLVNSRTESFGLETKIMAMTGAYVLSEGQFEKYYFQSLKIRRIIYDKLMEAFGKYDAVILPSHAVSATRAGDSLSCPEIMMKNLKIASLASLTGCPAVVMPFGKDKNGISCGVQIIAKDFDENKLFQIGKVCESF